MLCQRSVTPPAQGSGSTSAFGATLHQHSCLQTHQNHLAFHTQPLLISWGHTCAWFVSREGPASAVSSTPSPDRLPRKRRVVTETRRLVLFFTCWVKQGWAQQREQAAEERQEVNLFSVDRFRSGRLSSLVASNASARFFLTALLVALVHL